MDVTPYDKTKPLLIYDGDCGFCLYWVQYWQKLTGEAVQYRPYQMVAQDFPALSEKDFRQAVQYVNPNGEISSGAKASFQTIQHAKGKGFWITLYNKLPGFAFFAEKSYALISRHRSFFYTLSLLLWGKNHEPSTYKTVGWIFLRLFGLIYLAAFLSFSAQALGLIGSQGIIPVNNLVRAASAQLGTERYTVLPMIFWFNSSDIMIQAVCWIGTAFAVLLTLNILPRVSLIVLFIFYLSLCTAGQQFMSFQWDMFLLETGIVALFLFRFASLGIWLLRWLLFRFMWAGGLVKIFSGDATWQDFSALKYYFETEPIPSPLAWYAHHLPSLVLSFATGATLVIELILPFFIFLPRRLRYLAAIGFFTLQTIIILTGNYNFFNLLTILLCLALFDDRAIRKILPARLKQIGVPKVQDKTPGKLAVVLAIAFVFVTVSSSLIQLHLRFVGELPPALTWLEQRIAPLRLVNTYGPFAVMTRERMEIVLEGSDDKIHWQEYEFKYKPGDLKRNFHWNIPFQPRLDWQMWFAALGTYQQNPWVIQLMQRILENSPTVIALLDKNPFANHPPEFIRAQFYQYRFTTPAEKAETGDWWKRRWAGLYIPELSLKYRKD